MDLKEVRAKQVSDLTEDEKKFLEENKAELTVDERKTFGLETDDEVAAREEAEKKAKEEAEAKAAEEAARLEASRKKGTVSIEADRLAALEADAKAGREAAQKLAQREAEEFVSGHITAGRIKSGEKDKTVKMLLASTGEARTNLEAFIAGLPANERLNASERGDGGGSARSAQDELMDQAQKKVEASNGATPLGEAMKEILASDKELSDRVTAERKQQ